jgi:tRNA pseudouridine38-40 synthase
MWLAYDGTDFHGWQIQPGKRTVQGCLEEALAQVFGQPIALEGASRTDAGVHARCQVANFTASSGLPPERLKFALQGLIPGDIAVWATDEPSPGWRVRENVKAKRYRYFLRTGKKVDPFADRYAWRVNSPLDLGSMTAAAKVLLGTHDFKCLASAGSPRETTVRTISEARVYDSRGYVVFSVKGDGFLYHMVRNTVAVLVEIGLGHRSPGTMSMVLAGEASRPGGIAPARGLFLERVFC